ncbi:fructosamine kinase family protein [Reyranella sp. CPCC 100927]|uniref:fructosamine kinase family protein n=1 Tax=Reyranella sp. CPCC 100927 TaxID=2599616 RepID=UPI0011B760FE|nr:fructosamine kinase family protein [Reyranella sp. CPCC 100927]TWT14959.1 phosphotransferase [Reyranella sp. CPCC 100927]
MTTRAQPLDDAAALNAQIEAALGQRPASVTAMADGGHGARLWQIAIGGDRLVAKTAPRHLTSEGRTLRDLAAAGWPVPRVHFSDDRLLVMDWIDHDGSRLSDEGAAAFAERLAALHRTPIPADGEPPFGYRYDVMIGGLPQINERWDTWTAFFRWKRVWTAAWLALRRGRLETATMQRIEQLGARLQTLLTEPAQPALIHGDLRAGNVLCRRGRVVAVIDPAVSWSHPEIEIAFTTLFGGFPAAFQHRYFTLNPVPPGFAEHRCAIYNLYPLLVHAALFGDPYPAQIARTLDHIERA